jgi:hypothetical protein
MRALMSQVNKLAMRGEGRIADLNTVVGKVTVIKLLRYVTSFFFK